jgi:hypothetical protein
VGIGASAGGLDAFTELLSALQVDTGMAYVQIQHLDPGHNSQLTETVVALEEAAEIAERLAPELMESAPSEARRYRENAAMLKQMLGRLPAEH